MPRKKRKVSTEAPRPPKARQEDQAPTSQQKFTDETGQINAPELLTFLLVRSHQIKTGEATEDKITNFKIKDITKNWHPVYFTSLEGKKTFIAMPPQHSAEVAQGVTLHNETSEAMLVILQNDGTYGLLSTSEYLALNAPISTDQRHDDDATDIPSTPKTLHVDTTPLRQEALDDEYDFTPTSEPTETNSPSLSELFYNEPEFAELTPPEALLPFDADSFFA